MYIFKSKPQQQYIVMYEGFPRIREEVTLPWTLVWYDLMCYWDEKKYEEVVCILGDTIQFIFNENVSKKKKQSGIWPYCTIEKNYMDKCMYKNCIAIQTYICML